MKSLRQNIEYSLVKFLTLGSLSMRAVEAQMANGSEVFSLLLVFTQPHLHR